MSIKKKITTKRTIGVLGIGAIGTLISCNLHANKFYELHYFSRTKKTSLNLISDDQAVITPITVRTSIAAPLKLDWLIICLKEHQFKGAQYWFTKLITPKTKIAVIRNGLNLKQPLLNYTGADQILECIIDSPMELTADGCYKSLNKPIVNVLKCELSTDFKCLFENSSISINQITDFKTESWKKLIESSTLGAILCMYNDTSRIFKDELIKQRYSDLIQESIKVARADGAKIENNFVELMLIKLMAYPDTKGSSMLTDMRLGKPLELGAKNGIISQLGKRYQIETPINDSIVKAIE